MSVRKTGQVTRCFRTVLPLLTILTKSAQWGFSANVSYTCYGRGMGWRGSRHSRHVSSAVEILKMSMDLHMCVEA